MDFLLTVKRDRQAAPRLLRKAIKLDETTEKITIDKHGANTVMPPADVERMHLIGKC